ncbi:MAG: cobalamin biosynthesis protein CbiX [Rhodobacteraceae bacterium]|nr:cobalamin biosynthesis protein CbiX [Paracoccaceae bacterium]
MPQSRRNFAILVSHGQPSDPEPQEIALSRLAQSVADALPDWDIGSATLSTPDRLEALCAEGPDNPLIFPLFMADGFFVSRVLPKRLAGITYELATPLGMLPDLPHLVAEQLKSECAARGWQVSDSSVLLAAHGSARGDRAAKAAYGFRDALAQHIALHRIDCGFVEQDPRIDTAARDLPDQTLCLPFFAQAGDHVKGDIPEALEEAQSEMEILPVIGHLPGIPQLIANTLKAKVASA